MCIRDRSWAITEASTHFQKRSIKSSMPMECRTCLASAPANRARRILIQRHLKFSKTTRARSDGRGRTTTNNRASSSLPPVHLKLRSRKDNLTTLYQILPTLRLNQNWKQKRLKRLLKKQLSSLPRKDL